MHLHVNFSVMTPLFAPIVRDLEARHGVGSHSGFVYGRDVRTEIAAEGLDVSRVRVLSEFLEQFDQHAPPDMAYLREKEQQYGEPFLTPLITGCRFVGQFDFNRARRIVEAGFRLIEALFDEVQPDAVVSDGVACTMSYIQYLVARGRGIPFLTLSSARISNRFYVSRSQYDRYERVEELFAEYTANGVPDGARARAEAYLQQFRETKAKPAYFLQWAKPPAVNLHSLRELTRLARLYYRVEKGSYILMSPAQAIAGRARRMVKSHLLDKRQFEQPVAGEKFIFFPLHYQPEQTTLIWAPYHIDQIATIENIAKALPIDHRLYVKEHRGSLGRREHGYYQRLKQIPAVRLINPNCDSHDLIQQASAVCVLTSTVAWEAMLYERPVVSLGEAFFNAYDQVLRVRALDDLPAAFDTAINRFTPDREMLIKFMAAHLEGTYEGNADYMPGISTRSVEGDRIQRLSDVVAGELGLTSRQPAWLSEVPA